MNATTNAAMVRMRKTAASDTTTGVDGPPTTNEGSGSDSGSEVTLPPEPRKSLVKVLFHVLRQNINRVVPHHATSRHISQFSHFFNSTLSVK